MKAFEKYLEKLYKAHCIDKKDKVYRSNRVTAERGSTEVFLYTQYNDECFQIREQTFNEMLPYLVHQIGYPYSLDVRKYENDFVFPKLTPIGENEWYHYGCIISKKEHAIQGAFRVFKDDGNQTEIDSFKTLKQAKEAAKANKNLNPKIGLIGFLGGRKKQCPTCQGTGYDIYDTVTQTAYPTCLACEGSGKEK